MSLLYGGTAAGRCDTYKVGCTISMTVMNIHMIIQ
jgi:hypothetical protein